MLMKIFWRVVASVVLVMVISGLICTGAVAWYLTSYLDTSMDIDLYNLSLDQTSIIYAKDPDTGEDVEVERLYNTQNRIWVDIEQIPDNLKNAFIAIEDERFEKHNGVDWKRTISAIFYYVIGKSSYGGSTITQQLIKNLTGEDEVRPERKIKEIFRAINLEKEYTKEVILECYLNTIFLGQGLNGVQTAANTYFGKDVSELSLAECASIAAITKYPTKYNPFINPGYNKERQEVVLNKMYELGMISEEELNEAVDEPLVFQKEQATAQKESKQSYFTDQVMDDVISDLMEEKHYTKEIATQMLYSGGLQIYVTMDQNIQKIMDEVYENPDSFPTLKGDIQPESAMVIIDPYTGAVLGMVGGRGEKTADRTLNRATQTYRAPGSSIKPISVYAPAIENDLITYGMVMDDTPAMMLGSSPWPKNYYSGYRGLMTIKKAVQLSVNTIPVKIMQMLTPQKSYEFMTEKLGITSLVEKQVIGDRVKTDIDYAPLTLGGLTKGMSVIELTAAYTPFVNKGIYSKPYTYTKVLDANGKVILEKKQQSNVAISEQSAFIMSKLLQAVVTGGTGTAAKLSSGTAVAGKTGTTDNDCDRWFVGYTPYYVGAVWFGYDQQKEIKGTTYNPALNAWHLVMEKMHENLEKKSFEDAPSGIVQAKFCIDSGKIPTASCALDPRGNRTDVGWFKSGTQPSEPCDVHTEVYLCTESNMLAGPYCPEATKKLIALLNLPNRELLGGIVPDDWQYVLPTVDEEGNTVIVAPTEQVTETIDGQEVTVTQPVKGMNSTCTVHTAPVEPFPPIDDENGTGDENGNGTDTGDTTNPDDDSGTGGNDTGDGSDDDSGLLPPPDGDVTAPYSGD